MKAKQIATTLSTAIFSLTILSSLNAEVFTQTYTTTPCENYELITEMLIGPGVARHPKGVRIPQAKEYQIGVFSNMVAKVIPTFTNGVILSTGNINQGGRSMTGGSLTNETSTAYWDGEAVWPDGTPPQYGSDKDLTNYFGKAELYDQAGIVLYIQPKNKTLNIPFVMASEEYFFDSDYFDSKTQEKYEQNSDKFAFFLKEIASVTNSAAFDTDGNVIDDGSLMTPYWNVAQLPGGGDVEISSVNQYTNTQYFISNVVTNEDEELLFPAYDIQLPIEYNGAIAGPVAVAENLDTNKIYKLKIIIADDGNNIVNSAVFLRARGITSGADLSNGVSGPAKLEVPGTATFTDVVTNIDAAAADDVKVTHYLPIDINDDDLPAIKASVTCTAGEVKPESWGKQGETNYFVWTIGSRFASGSNAVLTVNCPLPRTGIYQNITKVETSTGDMNAGNDRGECVTVVGDVEKPVLTVTAIETNKIYGTDLPLAGLQFVKSIDGTNETDIVAKTVIVTYTNELGVTVTPVKVGKYGIILSNIRGDNLSDDLCDITYVGGVLTIEPAPLTITACDTNKLYGTELSFSGKEFSVSGLIGDDKVETVTLASEGTAEDKKCKPEGYPIIASEPITGSGLENYVLDFQPGTLIIDQLEIEITPVDRTKPYGQQFKLTPKSFEITKGELLPGDKINSVSMTSDGASATAAASEVGYDILADGATGIGLENYAITYGTGTLYVAKFRIMIAADDTNKVYGTALNLDPTAFSVLVQEPGQSKLPNDEEVLTVTLESANATNEFAAAGVYEGDILPSHVITGNPSFKTNNYEIAFSNGTLTVTKAPLTIVADGTNRVYGTTVGFTGREFKTKPATLPNNEKVDTVTITSTYAGVPTAAAGTYLEDIVPSHVVTGSFGFKTNNYDIVFSNGTLTVMKAPLTIVANSTNKVFGTEVELDGTEFTTKPVTLPNGETVTNVTLTCPQTTNLLAAVGMYPIVPSHTVWGEDFNTNNYAIVFSNGTLKVTQADLTVIANDTNKVYNTTITFAGNEFTTIPATLPEGIAVSSVTLTSEKATSAATAAGTYKNEIVPSVAQGTGLDNYKIAYSNGTLKVTQADLMVIANDTNKVYNTTITFAGTEFTTLPATLPNGDAVTSVTLTSAKAADALTDVGTYVKEIQPSAAQGNGLENYAIAYSNGTLKVTQAALTVIANDTNKVYNTTITFAGNEFTTLPATLPTGVAVNAVTLTSEKAANAATAVGTYKGEIVPSDAIGTKLNNYAIAYSNGTLKVTQAALTVVANDTNKVYNTTITFAGNEFMTIPATLPNGDEVSSVTLTSEKATSAATAAGTYKNEIVPSAAQGTGLDNYKIAYSNGTLKVTQATLTVIANDASKVYNTVKTFAGTEFTTLPATLPNGDAVTSVTLTSAKAADALTDVGTYVKEIQPSAAQGNGLKNYAIAYSNGTLKVTQAALTVIANDASKVYNTEKTFTGKEFTTLPATLPTGVAVNAVTLTSEKAANAATAVGTYKGEIVPSNAVGTKLNNYDIAYSNGTLKVTKAGLTITANNASKAYGTVKTFTGKEFTTLPATLPAGIAVTSVTLTSAKAASAATAAGTYKNEIVPSAAVGTGLDNYSITYSKGTLTVSKVPLTIIADDKSRVYGSTLSFTGKEFTTLPTALPNGDKVGTVTLTSAKGADASTVVGTYSKAIVPSHIVTGINTNNYDITFSNGTLKVTQAALTVKVNDAKWNIKKPKPTYSFADFTSQLKGGDTVASVAGSAGLSQSDFTNKVWATAVPVKGDEGVYTDEIWIKLTSINGPRAANYLITVDPGDLTVDTALPELKTTVEAKLNRKDGLLYLKLTIENKGDGDVEPDSDYWVELKPGDGPVTDDKGNTYAHSYEIRSKTKTMPDCYDYQELTASVKAALRKIHRNADEAFHPNDVVKIGISDAGFVPDAEVSISVFHYLRWAPEHFIVDGSKFFIAGQLFNVADTDRNFKVSAAEKTKAAALLGENSADYLEVTRLQLLPYYHWSTADQTWK